MDESNIVQAQIEAAKALEHRLTSIEGAVSAGFSGVDTRMKSMELGLQAVEQRITQQNGRVGVLEEFRRKFEIGQAFAKGVVEGRSGLRRSEIAVLGAVFVVVGPLLAKGLDLLIAHL